MSHVNLGVVVALLAALGACSSESSSSIKLNELLASSDTEDDWVELYNPTDSEVSLAGYELRDDNNFWVFPEGKIPAGGFLRVVCDGSGEGGKASFRLSSGGELVSIHDTGGAQLDRVVFPKLQKATSYGRIPDGEGAWTRLGTPSPGKPNIAGAPADGGVVVDVEPLPDKGPTPDYGKTKPDYGKTKPDYGKTIPDYGKTIPDYGKTIPDYGQTKPDA